MGYDETLAPMAPGNLLVEHVLDRLCAAKRVTEANLVSDAQWHRSWGPASSRVTTHFVANTTVRGVVTVALLRMRERALERRARRSTPSVSPLESEGTLPAATSTSSGRGARREPAGH
jgi:CelD/BcsL family acetyltransferase involved in cellulose biosynthesis